MVVQNRLKHFPANGVETRMQSTITTDAYGNPKKLPSGNNGPLPRSGSHEYCLAWKSDEIF